MWCGLQFIIHSASFFVSFFLSIFFFSFFLSFFFSIFFSLFLYFFISYHSTSHSCLFRCTNFTLHIPLSHLHFYNHQATKAAAAAKSLAAGKTPGGSYRCHTQNKATGQWYVLYVLCCVVSSNELVCVVVCRVVLHCNVGCCGVVCWSLTIQIISSLLLLLL